MRTLPPSPPSTEPLTPQLLRWCARSCPFLAITRYVAPGTHVPAAPAGAPALPLEGACIPGRAQLQHNEHGNCGTAAGGYTAEQTPERRRTAQVGGPRTCPDIAVCALVTAILCVTWVPRTTGPADLRWDAAVYYVLGTSLAAGEGYALRSEPTHLTADVWPPLLPVVIAAAQRILHTSDPVVVGRWLRAFCFLVWLAFILGTFVVLRSIGDRRFAAAGTLLTGLHMTTVWLSDRVYADLPFAVCVLAAVGVAIKTPAAFRSALLSECVVRVLLPHGRIRALCRLAARRRGGDAVAYCSASCAADRRAGRGLERICHLGGARRRLHAPALRICARGLPAVQRQLHAQHAAQGSQRARAGRRVVGPSS